MTTYYRDPQVHITSAGIRVDERWYPLAELRAVWHLRQRRPLAYGAKLLRTVAIFAAMAVAVLVCAGWGWHSVLGRPGSQRVLGALIALAVVGIVAAILARAAIEGPLEMLDRLHLHGAARHELRAAWRGAEVVVFACDDAHRFGKVYRSLRRAIEGRAEARPPDRLLP
jgi:hypothetical protein